jgi:hypothetical protein
VSESGRRARFPRRTIHLDFHAGPDIPDAGARFGAGAFTRTFADAHVDSVTVFAKCHHGLLCYATDHPERHHVLHACIERLLPDPILRTAGPSHLETAVVTGERDLQSLRKRTRDLRQREAES